MTETHARALSEWKFDGIYSFYDHNSEDVEEYMDGMYYACINDEGELVGNFCFGTGARVPTVEDDVYEDGFLDVGLSLRPDLCGKGLGYKFFLDGLEFAHHKFNTSRFRLSVAVFNERAVKVYKKAGFYVDREVTNSYYKNKFYIMKYEMSMKCGDN